MAAATTTTTPTSVPPPLRSTPPRLEASSGSSFPFASSTQSPAAMVPDTERMAMGVGGAGVGRARDASTGTGVIEGLVEEDGPGPCEESVQAAAFNYRVVCEDGAYVRVGLELSSRHIYTVGSQSIVEVTERCVNNQGLARLRMADGWISEMLNPLSGQRGPIVEIVPLQRPLKYRVVYPQGALVRSGVELSSSVVGTVPAGVVIVVNEKRFSNTPSYRCVPRLRLADGAGWISVRINSPPPEDAPVVQLLGFAEERDLRAFGVAPLGPPVADAAGMIEMEEEYEDYDDEDDDDDDDDDGSYDEEEDDDMGGSSSDSGSSLDGEEEGDEDEDDDEDDDAGMEDGEDSRGTSSLARLASSQGEAAAVATSPRRRLEAQEQAQEQEQAQGREQERDLQRRRRRRRREELSSSSLSSQGGGGGPSRPPTVFLGPKPGAGARGGCKSFATREERLRWQRQQEQERRQQQQQQQQQFGHQHEPHADNDKIVRALNLANGGKAGGGAGAGAHDDSCLVCFSSARTATFVHGETGHISCCLECARVLKGRGDPCPVCRLPIDRVIQHFWT